MIRDLILARWIKYDLMEPLSKFSGAITSLSRNEIGPNEFVELEINFQKTYENRDSPDVLKQDLIDKKDADRIHKFYSEPNLIFIFVALGLISLIVSFTVPLLLGILK